MPRMAIADLGFAQALLTGERRLLELVAAGEPLPVVLDAVCTIAEATGSGLHCSILLVDRHARFHFGAGRTLPPGFDRAVEDVHVGQDAGPCGIAASLKAQVVVADLAVDPRWQGLAWRAAVIDFGLRSAWSTPILSRSGAVLGTFAIWHEQPGAPTALDQTIIEQFTHIASIAIERSQREADLQRSEAALDEVRSELARVARMTTFGALTASIAHEVNQPLAGIVTNASTSLRMLAEDPPNVEGARETARRTIRDANRAAEVIARLRALFAQGAASPGLLELNEATHEVIALSAQELQRERITVRCELAPELPAVPGDRVQLQQVVLNLLLNAKEALLDVVERPREITIRTRRDAEGVLLAVTDSGVGLDGQDPERLFDAFYTTKSQGMGIGLSVSRSIIESHHGRLWAARNEGPGATFAFFLPIASH
jgi:C4-dicarboxylate-specific signal transduction histidine kinase